MKRLSAIILAFRKESAKNKQSSIFLLSEEFMDVQLDMPNIQQTTAMNVKILIGLVQAFIVICSEQETNAI